MKIETNLKVKGFNIQNLTRAIKELKSKAESCNLTAKMIHLKKKTKRITVLKGPHVHKKARDQYQLTTHTKVLFLSGQKQELKSFLVNDLIDNNEDLTYHIQFKKYDK